MNIFKRISSFATNSWREFTEFQEPILDSQSENKSTVDVDTSTKNRYEENFVSRKIFNGLLKKPNYNNKKKSIGEFLEDPRSPTNDFARTPIIADNSAFAETLSPFNVQDMLDAVQSAIKYKEKTLVNTNHPEIQTSLVQNTEDEEPLYNESEKKPINHAENNIVKIDEICNWNHMKFKEKPLTESLIVEISTTKSKDLTLNESETSSIDHEVLDESKKICKIIGYSVKKDEIQKSNSPVILNDENFGQLFSTSTPKKANSEFVSNNINKPRTPLMSIGNSPCFKSKSGSKSFGRFNKNKRIRKRIVNPVAVRKLPKAPSTPMTPLNRNKFVNRNIIEYDKENF